MSERMDKIKKGDLAAPAPAGQAGSRRRPGGPGGHGPGAMMMPGEKPKDFKGSLRKLSRFLRPHWLKILAVLVFAAASTVFTIVGPKVLARATNRLYEGVFAKVTGVVGAGIDFAYIGQILLTLAALYAIGALFSYIQGFIMSGDK